MLSPRCQLCLDERGAHRSSADWLIVAGLPGMPAMLGRTARALAPKARTQIAAGEIITIATPGGGGYRSRRQSAI